MRGRQKRALVQIPGLRNPLAPTSCPANLSTAIARCSRLLHYFRPLHLEARTLNAMALHGHNLSNGDLVSDIGRGVFLGVGRWGNAAGPGYWMLRVFLSGTMSSTIFGLAGASLGGFVWGTASIPFLVSACAGFVFGAVGLYMDAITQSGIMLERYPRLLQLHLDVNFPNRDFLSWKLQPLRAVSFSGSWVLQSMLVTSWLSALPAIEVSHCIAFVEYLRSLTISANP